MSNPEAFSHLPSEGWGGSCAPETVPTFWFCRALSQSSLVLGRHRDFFPGEREEPAKSSPKGMPCSMLCSRLPAREIKRVPGGWGRREAKRPGGEHPVPSFLLLPLELRQEFDPS